MSSVDRRQSSAELVRDVAVAGLTRTPSPPEHSVTISRNAKGIAQFEVTVRGYDLDTVATDAMGAFGVLETAWPYPVNGGTGE